MPVLVLLLALILGVLVWRYSSGRKAAGPQLRPRFVGPDDDPDFLEGAVVDHEFGTTDVCIIVVTDRITDKYFNHYIRGH